MSEQYRLTVDDLDEAEHDMELSLKPRGPIIRKLIRKGIEADVAFEVLAHAARLLIADVRRRYPGEDLHCPYMVALDNAVRKFPSPTQATGKDDVRETPPNFPETPEPPLAAPAPQEREGAQLSVEDYAVGRAAFKDGKKITADQLYAEPSPVDVDGLVDRIDTVFHGHNHEDRNGCLLCEAAVAFDQLRKQLDHAMECGGEYWAEWHKADEQIERLRADNVRLREALEPFARFASWPLDAIPDSVWVQCQTEKTIGGSGHFSLLTEAFRFARAALAGEGRSRTMTPEELRCFREVHGSNAHRIGYDPDRYATISEALDAARAEALEEAARVAETFKPVGYDIIATSWQGPIAAAIRALTQGDG